MSKSLWIETAQNRIFAKAAGDPNATLVLGIHGWSQRNGWQTWEPLIEPLAQAGFYVVSLDMPGWGQSPAWSKTPGKSAVIAILDQLEKRQAVLMGKSWGGGVALQTALAFPARVQKLILTAPAFRGAKSDLKRLTQPVLLAWAKNDPVIPHTAAQEYLDHIVDIQFETYAVGGHSAAQKNAVDFVPKAIKFLNE